MQIVINIPDNMKVMCEWHTEGICNLAIPEINILAKAIANGTVLPKGHGRLIDADELIKDYGNPDIEILLENMDTIIEADKEKSK